MHWNGYIQKNAIYYACVNDSYDALEWWKNSGMELKYDKSKIVATIKNTKMLHWFTINFPN